MKNEKTILVCKSKFIAWVKYMAYECRKVTGFSKCYTTKTSFKRSWYTPLVYTNKLRQDENVLPIPDNSHFPIFAIYIGRYRHNFIVRVTNLKTGKTGAARFNYSEDEDFDIDIGLAIAWARYCDKDVFELNENMFDPKVAKKGDRFKSTINGNKYILIENREYTDGYHCICYPSDGTKPVTVSVEDFTYCEKMKEDEDL